MRVRIVHEDLELIVAHKPAGWTVYPEAGAGQDLQSALKRRVKGELFPVHRLDRGTCGIVVFARSDRSARAVKRLFQARRTTKVYWAILVGEPESPSGVIREPLKSQSGEIQSATTRYEVRGRWDAPEVGRLSWVELFPESGRFHQLRRHLKGLGNPILGDATYGKAPANAWAARNWKVTRPLLSAVGLRLQHPRTLRILQLETQPDQDFFSCLKFFKF